MEQKNALTVTQLNEYIKMMFDSQPTLNRLLVRGEISNFVNHRSGHFYFTLKDEGSLIKAVMFKSSAMKINFQPENGMRVVARGKVSVFPRDGQYQLYADDMELDGIGALYVAFEQLKNKLAAEGLFDESRKKPLPRFPSKIGIITSPTGAAIRDMINVTGRRYPMAEITIYPALVQGSDAPRSLAAGIRYFNNSENHPDVIIIGRGGGSIEDLWAFNNEQLARFIANSEIPVISAVGHETDFTICDFVADRRAPTPSAAAELAVPDSYELYTRIKAYESRVGTLLSRKLSNGSDRLRILSRSRVLTSPETLFDNLKLRVDRNSDILDASIKSKMTLSRSELKTASGKLSSLSPLAVLSRGYGAVTDADGNIVKSVSSLDIGQKIDVTLSDGSVTAEIINKKEATNGN
ncbi:MAG: exodeoxyribonuclease VII large subunit [Ruminococcaceae bacterium]|nr:exodeoxyribonuclease VII large subunit [Oscillospiraceae bacterium]